MNLHFTVLTLMLIANASFADDNFFTMEEVAEHDDEDSCWTVIDGEIVYDITEYAPDHPRSVIYDMCGIDGTRLYDSKHEDERFYLNAFSSIEMIGYIGSEEQTSESEPPTGTEFPSTDPPTGTEFPTNITNMTETPYNITNMTETPSTSMPTSETGNFTTEPPTATTTTPTRSILEEDLDTVLEVDLEELGYHNKPDDCWVAYFGDVYDMTTYAPTHPKVGPNVIYSNCGEDGTDAYASVHPKALLLSVEDHIIAPLNDGGHTVPSLNDGGSAVDGDDDEEAAVPAPTGKIIGMEVLSKHDSIDDCWVAYYDNVYNMTKYAFLHPHPPGEYVIHMSCGRDGTVEYASIHAPDLLDEVKHTIVGKFDRSSSCPSCYFLTTAESILLALTVGLLTLGLL